MTFQRYRTMILVQLEMWRGCCQTLRVSKKQLAESIRKFSDELEKIKALDELSDAAAPDILAALKSIMTGGNHLALHISNSFGEHPAHDATHEEAAKFYKVGVPGWDGNAWKYDVWICWRAIMQARAAIAQAEGRQP